MTTTHGFFISLVFLSLIAANSAPQAHAQTFTDVDYPGVSDAGVTGVDGTTLVGRQRTPGPGGVENGFVYNGAFNELVYPGSVETTPTGVSGNRIVGLYQEAVTYDQGSFIYEAGVYAPLTHPDYAYVRATAIDGDKIVGDATNGPGGGQGFIYDNGAWTFIGYPDAYSTSIYGVDGDKVVGEGLVDVNGNVESHPFVYDGTIWTTFHFPGAEETTPSGISGSTIVGSYRDPWFKYRGFAYDGKYWSIINPPDTAYHTYAHDIDGNTIVGEYTDASADTHGYVTTLPATPNEFKFQVSGEITSVSDPAGALGGAVNIGDAVTGLYNLFNSRFYDETVVDWSRRTYNAHSAPLNYQFYEVQPTPAELSLSVSGLEFATGGDGHYEVLMADNDFVMPGTPAGDHFVLASPMTGPASLADQSIRAQLHLYDGAQQALASVDLPLDGLDVTQFASRIGSIWLINPVTQSEVRLEFRINSITAVPEPSCLAIATLASSLPLACRRYHRKTRRMLEACRHEVCSVE